jgi:hypothetical protein
VYGVGGVMIVVMVIGMMFVVMVFDGFGEGDGLRGASR